MKCVCEGRMDFLGRLGGVVWCGCRYLPSRSGLPSFFLL